MAVTEAQRRASRKYSEKVRQVNVKFFPTDEDIWRHMEVQGESRSGYIKRLIREDMERGQSDR